MNHDREPTARANDIAYVRFSAPSIPAMSDFASAFGFQRVSASASSLQSYGSVRNFPIHTTELGPSSFLGFGILVDESGLETLSMRNETGIENVEQPIAARRVRLRDPDGFEVDAFCPREVAIDRRLERPSWNEGGWHDRERARLRLVRGPSRVRRLGHVVLGVTCLDASIAWYRNTFGFRISDLVIGPDNQSTVGAFLRCDLGPRPVDHHSLFLSLADNPKFMHAAYEVENFNDLMTGHDHLLAAGATHVWGIGRHILGNHIFDYWRDPFGNELEHWTDGDLLDFNDPPGRHTVETLLGTQWGRPHARLAEQKSAEFPSSRTKM